MYGRTVVAVGIAVALCTACGTSAPLSTNPAALSGTITVFAASSLTAAYTAIVQWKPSDSNTPV